MRRPRPRTGRCPWRLALGGSGSVRAVPCAPGGLGAAPCPAAAREKWLPARIRAWPHCDPVAISSVLVSKADRRDFSPAASGVLSWSAVVSLQLLSCVEVIVPDRFRQRKGSVVTMRKTDGRSFTTKCRSEMLQAWSGRLTLAWKHERARTEGCVEYSPTVRGRRLIREIERLRTAAA